MVCGLDGWAEASRMRIFGFLYVCLPQALLCNSFIFYFLFLFFFVLGNGRGTTEGNAGQGCLTEERKTKERCGRDLDTTLQHGEHGIAVGPSRLESSSWTCQRLPHGQSIRLACCMLHAASCIPSADSDTTPNVSAEARSALPPHPSLRSSIPARSLHVCCLHASRCG